MRPIVDRDACIGCGACEGMDPEVFKVIDSKSEVQVQDAEGNMIDYESHKDMIDRAIGACPVSAISWSGGDEADVAEMDAEDGPSDVSVPAEGVVEDMPLDADPSVD